MQNAAAAANSLHSCLTLCDPMDCSLPGFSIRGIFQARVFEWVAISTRNAKTATKTLRNLERSGNMKASKNHNNLFITKATDMEIRYVLDKEFK